MARLWSSKFQHVMSSEIFHVVSRNTNELTLMGWPKNTIIKDFTSYSEQPNVPFRFDFQLKSNRFGAVQHQPVPRVYLHLPRASLPRHGDVVCIDLQSKILKGVAIVRGTRRVDLGLLQHSGVVVHEVFDVALAKGQDVIESMDQIGREKSVGVTSGHGIAERAHLF